MYRSYSAEDLEDMVDRVYYGYLRHTWDPVNRYYLGDQGHASTHANSIMMMYHILRHLRRPNSEHVFRSTEILKHMVDNWDVFGTGALFDVFDHPEKGSSAREWIAREVLIAFSIALKHSNVLSLNDELLELVRQRFERCFNVTDRLFWGTHWRDNQDVASYFAVLGFAYWATADPRFLEKGKQASEVFDYIYTRDDPQAIRETRRGCYPDWTWNYAHMFDVYESGGATHSPTYENAHFAFWLMGHRLFKLAGVTDTPWIKHLVKAGRVCLLSNIAANGMSPYLIEAYMLPERYQPSSQLNMSLIYAGWAATCPEALPDPEWAGWARFLVDRTLDTVRRVSDSSGLLPQSLYFLSETYGGMVPARLDNNRTFLHWVTLLLGFGDLDALKPSFRPHWDWRWFWDLVHVRGERYDAHLAGWTNRKREDRGTHRGHPPESWVDPLYVGGSVARLFTSSGEIVFPMEINQFGWKVETEDGILDSCEACMGRPGTGYEFWVEVDGRRIPRPEDYGELDAGTAFRRLTTHWRVVWPGVGEMTIENNFTPEKIAVCNRFVPTGRLHLKRLVQPIPFTRLYDRVLKQGAAAGETLGSCRIDWQTMFEQGKWRIPLAQGDRVVLAAEDSQGVERTVVTCQSAGELVVNDGMLMENWPDGWNYLGLVQLIDGSVEEAVEQRYELSIDTDTRT
ncbi:MAG: hypothetical protein HYY08_03870 [Firmicutes bacterium]|nr:hypothetical protein [Bacillota bacterium]